MKKISLIFIILFFVWFFHYFSNIDESSVNDKLSTDYESEIVSVSLSSQTIHDSSCSNRIEHQTNDCKYRKNSKNHLEIPAINDGEVIFWYSGMTIKYDTIHFIPAWVAYELTVSKLEGDAKRASSFRMDLNYNGKQAMREDYSNSGWDKGHMAPAADMKWSETAMQESFYLTNICPQNHELNTQSWQKLERWCRNIALKYGSVYIVTGPIITTNHLGTIGERHVAVPDRFFKALLIKNKRKYHSIAFVMDNDSRKHSMSSSSLSVNDLEELSGIDFFPALNDSIEETVESENYFEDWNR